MKTVEAIDYLDFRHEMRCEFAFCNNYVTHITRLSCGDSSFMGCAYHASALLAKAEEERALKPSAVCRVCKSNPSVLMEAI